MAALDGLFEDLVKRGGSDLHVAVNQPPLARVRGEIVPLRDQAIVAKELEEMLLELLTTAQRARLTADLDLDLAVDYKDIARFRASYYVKHGGIAAAFRLVPMRVPSLAELGCPEVLWRLADRLRGLIVIAGPGGNGKTTTTAAMIDHVNKTRSCHIVTIENPVEFVHEPLRAQITQREIGTHTPSVSVALRNAARESADVVFVSELSVPGDIDAALELANDGILVLANVSAPGVVTAVQRLVGTAAPEAQARTRGLLASSLSGVIVQHLVRASDSKNRLSVHEILVRTPAIAELVRGGSAFGLSEAIRAGEAQGTQSLDANLERLVKLGKISPEAALERAIDREAMAQALRPPDPKSDPS